jgi:hypothetical protein
MLDVMGTNHRFQFMFLVHILLLASIFIPVVFKCDRVHRQSVRKAGLLYSDLTQVSGLVDLLHLDLVVFQLVSLDSALSFNLLVLSLLQNSEFLLPLASPFFLAIYGIVLLESFQG